MQGTANSRNGEGEGREGERKGGEGGKDFLTPQDVEYGKPLISYCSLLIKKHSIPTTRAMVFGCAGGYTSFQLSNTFQNVCTLQF